MDLHKPIVLFGNGDIPTHHIVHKKLQQAKSLICVDGGADNAISLGLKPDIILGDLDSIYNEKNDYNCEMIHLKDQSKNDLEKTIEWCVNENISEINLIGFSGGRDDHYITTLEIIKQFIEKLKITMYTNTSVIYCVNQHVEIQSIPGQKFSIISFLPKTKITTSGLKYSLNASKLESPSHGISNIALKNSIEIQTDNWVFVFKNHMP